MKLKKGLQIFGGLAIILFTFRFIAVDYWWVRMFDFPHVQWTVLTVVALLTFLIKFEINEWRDYVLAGLLVVCLTFQVIKIYPYTPLAPMTVGDHLVDDKNKELSIYSANVFQKNEKKSELISRMLATDADVLLFMETDTKWQEEIVSNLPEDYAYWMEVPLPNTYGMLMYSKKELRQKQIRYLVDDSIPSMHAQLKLDSGDWIQLYAIHPTPPMPMHNPMSTDRDAEMMITADLVRKSELPVIVMGDFNDVAWSDTTHLFENVSELLDPRKGRGLFNTFNAKNILLRWPLDHLFVSPEFRVKEVKRGEDIASDHFPMYAKLSFEPESAKDQMPEPASKDQLERAENQIEKLREAQAEDAKSGEAN